MAFRKAHLEGAYVIDIEGMADVHRFFARTGCEREFEMKDRPPGPPGCAFGLQAREDDTKVFCPMSYSYDPVCALGLRWNDPVFGIQWPEKHRDNHEFRRRVDVILDSFKISPARFGGAR